MTVIDRSFMHDVRLVIRINECAMCVHFSDLNMCDGDLGREFEGLIGR